MKQNIFRFLALLSVIMFVSCSDSGPDKTAPSITAQGFDIRETREGIVGKFTNIRLRIESAARIKTLQIKERSYEIDLASTPERNHLPLFGIERKAFQKADITLDFSNYINQKLMQEGEYQFVIKVEDKQGAVTNAILNVRILRDESSPPVSKGKFDLRREGKGQVENSEAFGITWITVDEIMVTIRLARAQEGANKLAAFTPRDYERIHSRQELHALIRAAHDTNSIQFDTSSNAARDQVFGIDNLGNYYLLRILKSDTSLSANGTTVNLSGEYIY